MTALTRGPLPARVYWTRRLVVAALAVAVVAAGVRVAGMFAGEPEAPVRAANTSGSATPGPRAVPSLPPPVIDDSDQGRRNDKGKGRKQGPVLAAPEGPCDDSDIAVTPAAKRTVAGSPVQFVLGLRTISSPACTWEVSPDSLTVKITSGKDEIWSSRECPRAIPSREVVVRDNATTELQLTWSARRSDEGCTRLTEWALPGWYHINAAALAGEPSDFQFELAAPEPEVVTETVEPDPKRDGRRPRDKKRDGARR